ncbi:MAG TPA: HAD family hydrolase [Sutterella sp.]|nr:HAD family hydrolase [Sutterella sp.]
MVPKFDFYVFDWDGTVMDTTSAIAEGIIYAFEKLNYNHPDLEKTKSIIGTDWMRAIFTLAPDFKLEDYADFEAAYREYYLVKEREVTLFPGIEALLVAMREKGLLTAIATGKSRRGLNRVFAQTGIAHLFDDTITADEARAKPDPLMLEILCSRNGVDPQKTVMIGDASYDIELAKNAGCACVAVSFGAFSREKLAAYHVPVCDTIEELKVALGLDEIL